jgi:hypothetical protein
MLKIEDTSSRETTMGGKSSKPQSESSKPQSELKVRANIAIATAQAAELENPEGLGSG